MTHFSYTSTTGFWSDLPRPFFCLAPMADVTDRAFRRMFAKYGKPDITWTEFVSADGLFLRPFTEGACEPETHIEQVAHAYGISSDHPLLKDLEYTEVERPIVAQFFSKDPERMKRAASMARDMGFDGIDINMGCPAAVICRQGAGSAMIKTPELAQEIIQATIEGAGGLPVSVKTRIGYNTNELETWLPKLLEARPVSIILHARTRKDMSKVPAKWDTIARAVEIRDELAPDVLIVGNGDVDSLDEARERVAETGCDGVMIGRGIFGNPWFFNTDIIKEDLPVSEILNVLLEHTRLFEELLGDTKNFHIMKKHFKAYLQGFDGVKGLRAELMECEDSKQMEGVVTRFQN